MENIKFIFDKRKLDTLIRLGVPDSALLELLKTGVAPKTGDALIDDYLKSVLFIKKFKNTWGGKRDGSGKKQRNSNTKAFHLEKQDDNQLDCQVVDIDIDKDKDNISLENKGGAGGKENLSKKQRKTGIDLSFLADSFLKEAFLNFLDFRKEIKKPYTSQKSVVAAFNKLQRLSGGVLETAEAIVNQSIENQWQGLFPLKEEKQRVFAKPVCDYDALLNVDLSGIGEN